jgi:hypothetical protein
MRRMRGEIPREFVFGPRAAWRVAGELRSGTRVAAGRVTGAEGGRWPRGSWAEATLRRARPRAWDGCRAKRRSLGGRHFARTLGGMLFCAAGPAIESSDGPCLIATTFAPSVASPPPESRPTHLALAKSAVSASSSTTPLRRSKNRRRPFEAAHRPAASSARSHRRRRRHVRRARWRRW